MLIASRTREAVIETLLDSTDGVYKVTTAASTYVIDLDHMVLRRMPRTEDTDRALLRRDDELITLLGIAECTVGRPMTLHIDLHVVGVAFSTRGSTRVVSIERIASPGSQPN